jgi:hypothetical protein
MELNEKDREKINRLIAGILEERRIETQDHWEEDFSKEHDFACLLEEFEKYLTMVENYEAE